MASGVRGVARALHFKGAMKRAKILVGPVRKLVSYTCKVRGEHGSASYSDLSLVPEQVRCYLSSRPAGVVDVEYSECCAHCSGSGRVRIPRRIMAWKPCPVCNGAPEFCAPMRVATYSGLSWSDRA